MKNFSKNLFKPLFFALLGLFIFSSCSRGNDSTDNTTPNISDSYWKFANNTYNRGAAASSQNISNGLATLVVSTANDTSHGAFSGSSVIINCPDSGAGSYRLISESTFISTLVNNPTAKVMMIKCSVGTGVATGSTMYTLQDDTTLTANVTKDSNGKYHITISDAVTLKKSIDVNGGVAGSASSYAFIGNNLY